MPNTYELIKLIGSPFCPNRERAENTTLEKIYPQAFSDRVALLLLALQRDKGPLGAVLEEKYQTLKRRQENTLRVIGDLGEILNPMGPQGYAVFKSLKPYPATPNDTDVIIFDQRPSFEAALNYLYDRDFIFHEWAPMQTTLIHPRGRGKTGQGKKGGTWYVDIYSDISTDYFLYIDKKVLLPHVETRRVDSRPVRNVRREIELAIILFHNVFPERTYQLEHFYMPLYHLAEPDFDPHLMIRFAREQRLTRALALNLTLGAHIHNQIFGFVPKPLQQVLDGLEPRYLASARTELARFVKKGASTPYMISPSFFWATFFDKIWDRAAFFSLISQGIHMLNPLFFADVVKSLMNRFSEKGTYHLE